MNPKTLPLLLLCVLSSQTAAQEVVNIANALDRNAAYFAHIPSVNDLVDDVADFEIYQNAGVRQLASEIDGIVDASDRKRKQQDYEGVWSENVAAALKKIVGNESISISGYISNGKLEHSVFCEPKIESKDELLSAILSIERELIIFQNAINPRTAIVNQKMTWKSVSEFGGREILEFGFASLGENEKHHSLFFSLKNGKAVITTSLTLAKSIVENQQDHNSKCLLDDRTFLSSYNRIKNSKGNSVAWVYFNPRLFNAAIQIDDLITLDLLLPRFYEKLKGMKGANETTGVGLRLLVLPDTVEQPRRPRVIIDGFIRTAEPQTGVFSALATVGPIELPPVEFADDEVEYLEIINIDFFKVFDLFGVDFERENGKGSWNNAIVDLEKKYKTKYQYSQFYERAGNCFVKLWLRHKKTSQLNSMSFLRFSKPEFADWFAEMHSQSGFLNQTFPFERQIKNGHLAFERSENTLKAMGKAMRSKPRQKILLAADDWFIEGGRPKMMDVANDFGQSREMFPVVGDLINIVSERVGVVGKPFYVIYRTPARWAGQLSKLKRLLNFERENRGSSITNAMAPKSFEERLAMTARYHVRNAMIESFGETVFFVSADRNSIRFTFGCFKPQKGISFESTLPELSSYILPIEDSEDESSQERD